MYFAPEDMNGRIFKKDGKYYTALQVMRKIGGNSMLNEDILDTVVRSAMDAMRNAYTEHNTLSVGACVMASDGTIYTGCTIDNSCAPLTMTAEMVAMAKAVSDGKREFDAIAVIADTEKPYIPSGLSCQLLAEFRVPEIIMANVKGDVESVQLEDLFPYALRREEQFSGEPTFLFDVDEED